MVTVRLRHAVGLTLCFLLIAGPAWSQDPTGSFQTSGTAYYTFARPGQNTIEVLVLGGSRSGMYEVGEDIDLGKLMALAGGGGGGGRTKVTVHLFRIENGERTKILEEEMDEFTSRSTFPGLQEGDVVRIETEQRSQFGLRDALQLLTTVTALTVTFERLFN